MFHSYKWDQSISILRVIGLYFLIFIQIFFLKEHSVSSGDPDENLIWPRGYIFLIFFITSGPDLHCLPMSHKKDLRLILVKHVFWVLKRCSFFLKSHVICFGFKKA